MNAAVVGLPIVPGASCPGLQVLNPVCQLGGAASSIASSGAGAVLDALARWVVSGADWLLGQIGAVLDTSTSIHVGAPWFERHYAAMAGVGAVVALPLLIASVLQAVVRQDARPLVRGALVHLPLALLLSGAAVELVRLSLAATDALASSVSSSAGTDVGRALAGVVTDVVATAGDPGVPTFVLLLGASLLAGGALVLWLELLVRTAAVYAAMLFLPLALTSLVWPAISHWARRLVDTLAALVLSKFVIVAVLSLAASALRAGASGGSGGAEMSSMLAGGALLILAAFSPFSLLRLLPMIEAGAVSHLEAARHQAQHGAVAVPRSVASYALRRHRAAASARETEGLVPGTGQGGPGRPGGGGPRGGHGRPGGGGPGGGAGPVEPFGGGGGDGVGATGAPGGGGDDSWDGGDVPYLQGQPSQAVVDAVMSGDLDGPPPSSGTVLVPPPSAAGGEARSDERGGAGEGEAGSAAGSAGPGGSAGGTSDGVGGVGARGGAGGPAGTPAGGGSSGSGPGLVPPRRYPIRLPPVAGPRGAHELDRDSFGPVLRWRPPDQGTDGDG